MYHTLNDFINEWEREYLKTKTIFEKIAERPVLYHKYDKVRSLERLAWHITQKLSDLLAKTGLTKEDKLEMKSIPESFDIITNIYQEYSEMLISRIKSNWKNDDLKRMIETYGQQWKIQELLDTLIKHQIHHRGQMTTLMRLNNMMVPGIYGPSKEEWSKYGMPVKK